MISKRVLPSLRYFLSKSFSIAYAKATGRQRLLSPLPKMRIVIIFFLLSLPRKSQHRK